MNLRLPTERELYELAGDERLRMLLLALAEEVPPPESLKSKPIEL
jgi:hypothetical protein